ncbi:Mercuric reductase [subsurface metagenome]
MKFDCHVIVIGAGSGGLVVASGAAQLGAKVVLIESDKMGGECLNTGCVPSKTFLKSAHVADDIRNSNYFGLRASLGNVNLSEVGKRVKSVIKAIEPHDSKERFESLGVDVFLQKGTLIDKHTVRVGERNITGKNIIIATGSKPLVPPIPGLKDVAYLTNENVFDLTTLPKNLIVLGGGPVGLEFGQGFRYLGSEVSIVDMLPHIFVKDDPEVAPIMEKKLESEGINLFLSSKIIEVKKERKDIIVITERNGQKKEVAGDYILVALGRVPNTKDLGLENAGIKTDKKGYVVTNERLQTNVKNIYACGDVTGPYLFTHMASYQAGIIVRNIIFRIPSKVDYSGVTWTTYTKPEVAHVGYTEPWAKSSGLYKDSLMVNLEEVDRAKAEKDEIGFLKLITGKRNKLIGATVVGEKAGEMIHLATLAIKRKLKATAFINLIFSYPTEAEIFKFASSELYKRAFKGWMKKLIKALFL